MNTSPILRSWIACAVATLLAPLSASGQGGLTLANPHWNITLTDFGYSDFLLDNTPGFEGREYLSGEWGAAVGYQVSGGASVTSQWLEPNFLYPDWPTNSTFTVVSPLAQTGLNAENLPVAQSVIANAHLEITQRFEMLDTVTGTPMGTTPASAAGAGTFSHSNRYVMKQTYTVKNIAGAAISNIQLFQLLHGLNSQRGLYDNRIYSGPLGNFNHDTTLAGVDSWAAGAGAGLEDFISFHATSAPTALEIGYYGIEGNGVDNHGTGKPTDGVHLSIEDNWLASPYNTRQGTDYFAPPTRWVSGAQRWELGNLSPGQAVSFDVLFSNLTGTKVPPGPGSAGSCDGGSSVPGGIDYEFESVETEGTCFSDFARPDQDELDVRIAQGEFSAFTFQSPSQPAQVWEVEFSGTFTGAVNVNFGYDPTLLPPGLDESGLAIYHFTGSAWVKLPGTVNVLTHSIGVSTTTLGPFALGVDALTTFTIAASTVPANSGTVTGAGEYAQGSAVSLAVAPNPGYVFANWTEDAAVVSTSPNFTFEAQADRSLVANFALAGTGKIITTSSTPAAGGSTSGGGEYAIDSSATVIATPSPGYKFSKWLVNGASVSTSSSYTFTVTADRTLVAKFKPVYVVTVVANPPQGGDPEVDAFYELNELAKLKSKPNTDWSLVNWTQNGVVVSTDIDFNFNVTGNRDLVANYALGKRIDLVADPKTAGNVTGEGVFPAGNSVTVSAEARPGYIFLDWTEFDTPVSTDADYTFTSDVPRLLTARFAALPSIAIAPAPAPGQLVFTWPDVPNWVLKESPDLVTWTTSTRTVTASGGQKSVTVTTDEGRVFFRLAYQ
jgi:uncharacterized repeat protein (TIGR02543 family)